jgi:pimeloyl-ACP methyl ester carboxylesterase
LIFVVLMTFHRLRQLARRWVADDQQGGMRNLMTEPAEFEDGYWEAADGVRLHYRDYATERGAARSKRPPVICLPGLSRNARDFEHVATRLSPEWRVICPELRGRGESGYAKDPASYNPLTYMADLEAMLTALKIKRAVFIGTSLGGILTILLTAANPSRTAAAMINDIGPDIDPAGLSRIRSMVGRTQSWPTWVHAARWMEETQGAVFPDYDLTRWVSFAKRTCRLTAQGRITLDYDMRIGDAMRAQTAEFDLWPIYGAMGDTPVTILRGAITDILSDAAAKRMAKHIPNARLVTVKGVGHAPMLDEPEAVRAIDAMLKQVLS